MKKTARRKPNIKKRANDKLRSLQLPSPKLHSGNPHQKEQFEQLLNDAALGFK
jgi:hypothetical protein